MATFDRSSRATRGALLGLALGLGVACGGAWAQEATLPRLETNKGRHTLIVDDKPFIILGGQVSNSSNYVSVLPRVWEVARGMNLNTVEIAIAWEQVEAQEGRFDFAYLDQLVREARERKLRLVLLWFGAWKSGAMSYTPEWVKSDTRRFPRQIERGGEMTGSLSPFGRASIEADKTAYTTMLKHLQAIDPQRTVIMVQVENEPGTLGGPRDFSPAAQAAFARPVPADLIKALGKKAGSWGEVFGAEAEKAFASWSLARAVGEIAAAGKAVYPLPTLLNAPGTNPLTPPGTPVMGPPFASGGPDWASLDIWKAMAPSIDILAPNIYSTDPEVYGALLDRYGRPDNPNFVPETGSGAASARFFWLTLGRGAVGFAPFGVDGAAPLSETVAAPRTPLSDSFRLFGPIVADWGAIAAANPVWGAVKGKDTAASSKVMGRWKVTAEFGPRPRGGPPAPGPPPGAPAASAQDEGGAVVAQTGPDEFYVAGSRARVLVELAQPRPGEVGEYLTIEEGTFDNGRWVMQRRWNGDQRDFGMNFPATPALLRVKMHAVRP